MPSANVTERTPRGEVSVDVYTRLVKERIIWVGNKIDADVANTIMAQLLFLENSDREEDIYMYINSPGGAIDSVLGIYDTMQFIQPDVVTICAGSCYGAATILLAAGTPGKRYSLPNSLIHHRVSKRDITAFPAEVQINEESLKKIENRVNGLLARHTGQPLEKIVADFQQDRFLLPEEALQYGIIDEVITENPSSQG
jgi:ATP-dependent Clp protease protease subunit